MALSGVPRPLDSSGFCGDSRPVDGAFRKALIQAAREGSTMKRVRIKSAEDLETLPEGEWVEVAGGMRHRFVDETIRVEKGSLIVPLSRELRREFKPKPGESLEARVRSGNLVVKRRARAISRKSA